MLIVTASARCDGNTALVVDRFCACVATPVERIDLLDVRVTPFRYDRSDREDDFLDLVSRMTTHSQLVLATPVYWYAMSGLMKVFFDRLTDLLQIPALRPLGRALAGRDLSLIAVGADPELPPGFAEPFSRTAAYFGMTWRNAVYIRAPDGDAPTEEELAKLERFFASIE